MAKGFKTGGRKAGTPNKLAANVRNMILDALDEAGGKDYLIQQATLNPAAFMTLIGKVLPTQLVGDEENPVQFVIRGPSPVESAKDWLRLHAPITEDETTTQQG
jgi:hypothetical protein